MSGWDAECPACKGYLDQAHAPDCTFEPEDFLDVAADAATWIALLVDDEPEADA